MKLGQQHVVALHGSTSEFSNRTHRIGRLSSLKPNLKCLNCIELIMGIYNDYRNFSTSYNGLVLEGSDLLALCGQVVEDVKITVAQAAEPVESGFTNLNETLQENVSKMNDKFQDNVSKLNENVQNKVYKWGGRETEEISKEGTYFVNRDEDDKDDEIVQTHEHVALEHKSKDEGSQHGTGEASEVVKEEVSGTTTSRSTDDSHPHGEETISFRQQKEKLDSVEERKTSSTTKETNEAGQVEKDASVNVKEKFRLNSKGEVAGKETTAQKTEKTGEGDVVNNVVMEEQEERDKNGDLVTKEVHTSPTTR